MPRMRKNYSTNGVNITPSEFSTGDRIRIAYDGLLSQSGAQEIYAHIGYGTQKWDNINDVKMSRVGSTFEATIPVSSTSNLNIAFKDSADNWDNNSGKNYTFKAK